MTFIKSFYNDSALRKESILTKSLTTTVKQCEFKWNETIYFMSKRKMNNSFNNQERVLLFLMQNYKSKKITLKLIIQWNFIKR